MSYMHKVQTADASSKVVPMDSCEGPAAASPSRSSLTITANAGPHRPSDTSRAPTHFKHIRPNTMRLGIGDAAASAPNRVIATFQNRVWRLMDDPSSSSAAKVVAIIVMSTIGFSTMAFILETLPQFHASPSNVWGVIEAFCIALFTLEFLARLLSCPDKVKFCKSILNIVDFTAIMPFYIELLSGNSGSKSSSVFRVIRLVRVFRVFKISRYLTWIKTFVSAMVLSAWPLSMLLFVMAIGCVVFSSLIFYAERGEWSDTQLAYLRSDGKVSPYQSIPEAFYWCIITMSTVGYGDVYPITSWGRFIAGVTSIMGIMVLAVPITVISTNFSMEFNKLKKSRETMRARMMLLKTLNSTRRSGVNAMHDEVEELVKRNCDELRASTDSAFDSFREDLTEDLKEVVRIAYDQRKELPSIFSDAPVYPLMCEDDDSVSPQSQSQAQVHPYQGSDTDAAAHAQSRD